MPNLFTTLPTASSGEVIDTLLSRGSTRIERIVSRGEASPLGFWYDQDQDEWVLLLRGTATLEYDTKESIVMTAGDHLLIPQHQRHRVSRVSEDALWLAVYCGERTRSLLRDYDCRSAPPNKNAALA
jgi:cupin 2 domain-containing protein